MTYNNVHLHQILCSSTHKDQVNELIYNCHIVQDIYKNIFFASSPRKQSRGYLPRLFTCSKVSGGLVGRFPNTHWFAVTYPCHVIIPNHGFLSDISRVFGHFEKPLFIELCKYIETKFLTANTVLSSEGVVRNLKRGVLACLS